MKTHYLKFITRFKLLTLVPHLLWKRMASNTLAVSSSALILVVMLNSWSVTITFLHDAFADAGHTHGEELASAENQYPIVTIAKASKAGERSQQVKSSGIVLPYQESNIFPTREGVVQSLLVNVGDTVQQGQTIGYLFADAEQTILNADLQYANAQRVAIQRKKQFLDSLTEAQRIQLENGLSYANTTLGLAKTKKIENLAQVGTEREVLIKGQQAFKEQQLAKLEQLNILKDNAERRIQQQKVSSINGISDILRSVENLLFAKPGTITSGRMTDTTSARRSSVYNADKLLHTRVEKKARELNTIFQNLSEQSSSQTDSQKIQNYLNQALQLAQEAQQLSTKTVSREESDEQIKALQSEVDESVDHLVELSSDTLEALESMSENEGERIQILSELKQEEVERDGQLLKLRQKEQIIRAEQDSEINNQELVSSDLQQQINVFGKAVEQQKLDLEIEDELKGAESRSISQKIGAGRAIKAPFTGVISKRYVNVGESVNLDRPVFRMINDEKKYIRFFVKESQIPFIKMGSEVSYRSNTSSQLSGKARITRISPSLDIETRSIQVEADLIESVGSNSILAHMNVVINIPISVDSELFVVSEDSLELGGGDSVWVVNEKVQSHKQPVKVEFIFEGTAYVRGDLDGVWVVTKSPIKLEENLDVDTTQ